MPEQDAVAVSRLVKFSAACYSKLRADVRSPLDGHILHSRCLLLLLRLVLLQLLLCHCC